MPNNMRKKYYGGGMTPPKKKPYKQGGHTVPGMFQGNSHTLPKAQSGNFGPGNMPNMPAPTPDPFGGPKKRNWFGRQGTRIANIFRNDANDRSIDYQGYKNPRRPGQFKGFKRGGSIGPNGTL